MAFSDWFWPFLKIRPQKKSKFSTKKAKSLKTMHLMHLKWILGLWTYSECLKPLFFGVLSKNSTFGTKNWEIWKFVMQELGRRCFCLRFDENLATLSWAIKTKTIVKTSKPSKNSICFKKRKMDLIKTFWRNIWSWW